MIAQRIADILSRHVSGWIWPNTTCLSMVGEAVDHVFEFSDANTEEAAYRAGGKKYGSVIEYYRAELGKAGCERTHAPRIGSVWIAEPPVFCGDGTRDRGQAMMGLIGQDGRPWMVSENGLTYIVSQGRMEYWSK